MSESPTLSAAAPNVSWSSQVTHTAVAVRGAELWSATYTTGGGNMLAMGLVFDVVGSTVNMREPKRKVDLGMHTDEAVARRMCEAFCRGELSPAPEAPILAEVPSATDGSPETLPEPPAAVAGDGP